jgi:hypothetical protein
MTLTQNPAVVKGLYRLYFVCNSHMVYIDFIPAAASCFANLLIKESNNNVKLIILDHLDALHSKHSAVLDGLIIDVLQVLSRFIFLPSFYPSRGCKLCG